MDTAKLKYLVFLCGLLVVLAGLTTCQSSRAIQKNIEPELLNWYDTARQRKVPVAMYKPAKRHAKIVIFSHGYDENSGTAYLGYSFLNKFLAEKGWFVVSVQHELTTDSLMPLAGIPQIVRRPFWERGAHNIAFVIQTLKTRFPDLDYNHIALIGHSNGGDMTMLFPVLYPGIAEKVISLDNRRMALPRTRNPRVYSLRSGNLPADEGVLPTSAEQQALNITIIPLPATNHNDMHDGGTEAQKAEINQYVLKFLSER